VKQLHGLSSNRKSITGWATYGIFGKYFTPDAFRKSSVWYPRHADEINPLIAMALSASAFETGGLLNQPIADFVNGR